jgi:hypothetical protein
MELLVGMISPHQPLIPMLRAAVCSIGGPLGHLGCVEPLHSHKTPNWLRRAQVGSASESVGWCQFPTLFQHVLAARYGTA